ncbi:MAG: hypothetical protein P9L98_04265 [Candidatus Kaelpia imicola]|nr:hypothetical protein [Candidatus Kaelpia imicola]
MKRILRSTCGVVLGLFILSISAFEVSGDWNLPPEVDNLPVVWQDPPSNVTPPGDSAPINAWNFTAETSGKISMIVDGVEIYGKAGDKIVWTLELVNGEEQWVQRVFHFESFIESTTDGNYTRTTSTITDENGEDSLKVTEAWTINGETYRQLTTVVAADGTITLNLSTDFEYGDPNPEDNIDDRELLGYNSLYIEVVNRESIDWSNLDLLIAAIETNSEVLNETGKTLEDVANLYGGNINVNQARAETNRAYNNQGQLVRSITIVTDHTGTSITTTVFVVDTEWFENGIDNYSTTLSGTFVGGQ